MTHKIKHSFGPSIDGNPEVVGLEHTCSECGNWVIASAHHCVFCGARFELSQEPISGTNEPFQVNEQ